MDGIPFSAIVMLIIVGIFLIQAVVWFLVPFFINTINNNIKKLVTHLEDIKINQLNIINQMKADAVILDISEIEDKKEKEIPKEVDDCPRCAEYRKQKILKCFACGKDLTYDSSGINKDRYDKDGKYHPTKKEKENYKSLIEK